MKLVDLLQGSILNRKISEKLIGDLLKVSPERLFLHKNDLVVSPAVYKKFKKAEKAIAEGGLPYQYALGKGWFYGREFYVNKDVLIPRPETEILLHEAIKFLVASSKYLPAGEAGHVSSRKPIRIIDVGTGSGCIAISVAAEIAKLKVVGQRSRGWWGQSHAYRQAGEKLKTIIHATDISEKTLAVAKKNARKHKTKIKFLKSDLLDNPKLPQKFDLILANLPYLPSADIVPENSIYYEPRLALNGGKKGLDLIKKLIAELPNRLAPNGLAILEIDPRQKTELVKLAKKLQLKMGFRKDLNKRTRFAILRTGRDGITQS